MAFCDAHFHLNDSLSKCGTDAVCGFFSGDVLAATCAHSKEEFEKESMFIKENSLGSKIVQCFGLHPQMPLIENAGYLESLVIDKKISAIGETGHDFFTDGLKLLEEKQSECFSLCLDIALSYDMPLVIHNRKALEKIFENSKKLKKLPFVLFHSFAFSSVEANAILKRGINGYFSFSKQICNGNRKSISCVHDLETGRVLYETDAPYQTLKGEQYTFPADIEKVYGTAVDIKKMSLETLCCETRNTFSQLFGL
ncbi:MAG: TatD family hydrolase [Treponema sp.]|nr:TatD family hydrolase [Candidatus Treponema equi]